MSKQIMAISGNTENSSTSPPQHEAVMASIRRGMRHDIRLGWWIMIFGFGSFLLWASLAPLDKGVPLAGNVAVSSHRKVIQHETGGTVEKILVKDGDTVKAGDTLLLMDNVQAQADAESVRVQYLAAKAMAGRLASEKDGTYYQKQPSNSTQAEAYIKLQQQIVSARQAALNSELAAIDENILGLTTQAKGLEESIRGKREQLQLIHQQLEGLRPLAAEGYLPRNKLLDTEQSYAQISADIAEETGSLGRISKQISELKFQKSQRKQEYQKEVRTQLSEAQKQTDALESQLKGLDRNLKNVEIRSPVDGTVVGLSVFTKGAVISPGFKLMEIVPKEDSLIVEGQLPVHLIDKVHSGLPVKLMFTAFSQNKTPRVTGTVTQVSADRFIDEHTGAPYFKLTAKVDPEGMSKLKNLVIRPGMPVDVFVVTGERTMMNYLLKPIFDHLQLSMSEE